MVVLRKYFVFVLGISGFPEAIREIFEKCKSSLFLTLMLQILWFLEYQGDYTDNLLWAHC